MDCWLCSAGKTPARTAETGAWENLRFAGIAKMGS
jgi:hypothetical protein